MGRRGNEGMRKRQLVNSVKNTVAAATDDDKNEAPSGLVQSLPNSWPQRFTILLHLLAVSIFGYGVFLRAAFHNGEECKMTYSMLNYIPIRVETDLTSVYKLYKFVDSRDPRHEGILKAKGPIEDASHCNALKSPFIVLYIPGHWGSYSQCRSIGAHGDQMTGSGDTRQRVSVIQQALRDGTWNGQVEQEEKFVFDVYCADFAEQGSALHGSFIRKQSQFVARVVKKLSKECSVSKVHLVGHSIGGLVAKAVPVYSPSEGEKIQNIITLATPHAALPFAFDESISKVYHDLESLNKDILVVSISGGLKDELIPASLCEAKTGISQVGGSMYGMDHKAVVWCHQILEKVRKFLFILSEANLQDRKKALEQLEVVNARYAEVVANQKTRYEDQYGFLRYAALESAMIYNAELLLAMYVIVCGFYLAAPTLSPVIVVGAVAMLSATLSDHGLPVLSTTVLCFLAHAIVWALRIILSYLPASGPRTIQSSYYAACVSYMVVLVVVIFGIGVISMVKGKFPVVHVPSILVISSALWIWTQSFFIKTSSLRSVIFIAMVIVSIPILTFGKVVLFVWGIFDDFGSLDAAFAFKILAPIAGCIVVCRCRSKVDNESNLFAIAHGIAMYLSAFGMLEVGGGYLVGYYLAWVALIETWRLLSP